MKSLSRNVSSIRLFSWFFLISVAAYVMGQRFSILHVREMPVFWPGQGVYFAFLLARPTREWAIFSILVLLARMTGNFALSQAPAYFLLLMLWVPSTLTYLSGAWLLKTWTRHEENTSVKFWLLVLIIGGLLVPGVGAVFSTAVASFFGRHPFSFAMWRYNFVGKSLGIWVTMPLILLLLNPGEAERTKVRSWSFFMDFFSVGLSFFTALFVFTSHAVPVELRLPIILVPPLIWVALRGNPLFMAMANFLVAVVAIMATSSGTGPFVYFFHGPLQVMTSLQLYLAITILTQTLMNAAVYSRKKALESLESKTKELARTNESFDQLIEQASDGIFVLDQSFNILKVNVAACVLTGFPREQLVHMHIDQIALPQLNSKTIEQVQRVLTDGGAVLSEIWHRRADGTVFLAEVSAKKISDGRIQGIVRDVTLRKQMEDRLRKSDEQFRTLIETSPQIIFRTDEKGDVEFISKSWCEYTGTTKVTLAERNRFIHPEDLPEVLKRSVQAANSRSLFECEYRLRNRDGSYRWFLNRSLPLLDDEGNITKWIGFSADIHDQKQLAEVLLERSQFLESQRLRLETILNTIPTPVSLVEVDSGRTLFGNPAADEMVGMFSDRRELPSSLEVTDRAGKVVPESAWPHRRIAAGEVVDDLELNWHTSFGKKVLLFSGRLLPDVSDQPRTCVLSFRDITFLRQMEVRLRNANRELERFASIASHDLQEPLRTMTSYLQLLLKRHQGKLGGDSESFMLYIIEASRRMKALVNQLLEYARAGKMENTLKLLDCNQVASRAIADLQALIEEKRAEVSVSSLPSLLGHENPFHQLIQNLLSNGIRYNQSKVPEVKLSCRKSEVGWEFSVSDNGIGIAAKDQQRIFDAFHRVGGRSENPGTGLGLAVCKRIVESYGGRLWVESELDKGTVFYFTLPWVEAKVTNALRLREMQLI